MANQPIRWRIAIDITSRIKSGALQPGTALPSIKDMSEQYECSQQPVKLALEWLELKGWIVKRHGIGSSVALNPPIDDPGAYP